MHLNVSSHAMTEYIMRDATLICATEFGNSYYTITLHKLMLCEAGGVDQHGFHPMAPGARHGLPIYGTSKLSSHERGLPNIGTSPFVGVATHPRSCHNASTQEGKGECGSRSSLCCCRTLDSPVAASPPFHIKCIRYLSLLYRIRQKGSRGSPFAERSPNDTRKRANSSNAMLSSLPHRRRDLRSK